ncbi:MAG: YggS family pyridoxal phosphate enzyme [Micavibrio sp.]|nr:MAG: YggS family pyridoxal phosphate enzyme [Micavibrio sp.]
MSIADNLTQIYEQIEKTARDSDRDADTVHLVAVSKKQPTERMQAALDAGHRCFGENRVQEAQEHWSDLKSAYPDLKLHLIGPLQTNKAKEAVALFDVIETLDREKLARALAKEMQNQGKTLPCFVQVNTGEEPQKAGIIPADLPDFLTFCRDECELDIAGLMCIPPIDEPPALHFAFLAKLRQENNVVDLSMGMSSDFEKAIPLGATYIRVGTGIFGERASHI